MRSGCGWGWSLGRRLVAAVRLMVSGWFVVAVVVVRLTLSVRPLVVFSCPVAVAVVEGEVGPLPIRLRWAEEECTLFHSIYIENKNKEECQLGKEVK